MKSKKCSRRQKFLHLLKKLRYYIFATLVLLVAGIVFFFFFGGCWRVLLETTSTPRPTWPRAMPWRWRGASTPMRP